jgi:hypothetical protein
MTDEELCDLQGRSDNAESKSDISILMRGNRLEIMANVDEAGLKTLREMLEKYEEILKILKDGP